MNQKTFSMILGLCLVTPMVAAAADVANAKTGTVTVVFDHPENFTDVKDRWVPSDSGRDAILADIRTFAVERGSTCLRSGQKLEIKFTDIDLAGEFEPERGPNFDSVRIMRDIYIPVMHLEFKLTGADGKVLAEGKRTLRDMDYLDRSLPFENDPLAYDKRMLGDWLRGEIKQKSAAAH